MRRWMRSSPQRASGVSPKRFWKSVPESCSQSVSVICPISPAGAKQVWADTGAWRLWGQASWQMSQPNIHPCRSPSSPASASIVRREIQSEASIVRSFPIAPTGQASIQARQEPHGSGARKGGSGSSSASVTISPSTTNDPRPGTISSEWRPMRPTPASAEDRGRIDEDASRSSGMQVANVGEQFVQFLFQYRMVVASPGIRGDP